MIVPYGITLTVHRTVRDDFGDPGPGVTHTIEGCALAPRQSSEPTEPGRAQVIVGLAAYLPHGADVRAADVVVPASGRWAGVRWQVIGEPGDWENPITGWKAGTKVALERVTG